MGVHKRNREMEEVKQDYMKKSSCYLLVIMALLVGAFIGNTITMLYVGNKPTSVSQVSSAPQQQQQASSVNPAKLAELEKAVAANPTNVDGWIQLGHYCFDNNLPAKAAAAYEHVLELRPMDVGVWSDLGVMYRRTERFEDAIRAFKQAASLDAKHVVSRFNLGIVYLHDLNDKASALKAWKEVLAIDPNAKTPGGQSVKELVKGLES